MIQQTSLMAFLDVKKKLNQNQKLVLESLEEIFPATNKMIAKHMGFEINSVTPRMLELRQKQKVVQAYVGKDITGRTAIFWQPIQAKEFSDVA